MLGACDQGQGGVEAQQGRVTHPRRGARRWPRARPPAPSASPTPASRCRSHRKVDIRLPGKGNPSSHGARPVHQIISMMKWTRTSRLPTKNSRPGEGRRARPPATSASLTPAQEGAATTLQKCEAVPRRARIQGSYTFLPLNSRRESNREVAAACEAPCTVSITDTCAPLSRLSEYITKPST